MKHRVLIMPDSVLLFYLYILYIHTFILHICNESTCRGKVYMFKALRVSRMNRESPEARKTTAKRILQEHCFIK